MSAQNLITEWALCFFCSFGVLLVVVFFFILASFANC